jgi:hypothetical protein
MANVRGTFFQIVFPNPPKTAQKGSQIVVSYCEILGSYSGVSEGSDLLGCEAG